MRTGANILRVLVAVLLAGCAGVNRNPTPEELVDRARIPGLPAVRAWGADYDAEFRDSLVRSFHQEPASATRDHHVLAISAGGSSGAFGAGVLCGWSERGTRPEFKLVTGVSTGALIAPFAFVGPSRDASLRDVYTSIRRDDVVETRMVWDWLTADSLGDTEPLLVLLRKHVDRDFLAEVAAAHRQGRRLYVATTNLDAQRAVVWDMGAIADSGRADALELFHQVMIASSAIPGVFPPVYFEVEVDGARFDEMHVDGGLRGQTLVPFSLLEAARPMREALFGPGAVRTHLHVLRNGWLGSRWRRVPPRALDIAERAITTLTATLATEQLFRIDARAREAGMSFALAAIPEDYRPSTWKEFDREEMRRLFHLGLELGRAGSAWQARPSAGLMAPNRP